MTPAFNPDRLPAPLDLEQYRLLRPSIYDDDATAVFVNAAGDFAALDPLPDVAYQNYQSRVENLGLADYKKRRGVLESRLARIAPMIAGADSFVEIGAADAAFLALLYGQDRNRRYAAVEPDDRSRPARDALAWLQRFDSTTAAATADIGWARVGMFHVFEHLVDPTAILADIRGMLVPGGKLIIEVPCYRDPLLSLYECNAYAQFYFQRQHPYVYTGASLARVLGVNGFTVEREIAYQRYGLENHLQWLNAGKPGGNAAYREIFHGLDDNYRAALEKAGHTDTVILVATPS